LQTAQKIQLTTYFFAEKTKLDGWMYGVGEHPGFPKLMKEQDPNGGRKTMFPFARSKVIINRKVGFVTHLPTSLMPGQQPLENCGQRIGVIYLYTKKQHQS
jgi:hypothetical protein